MSDRPTVKLDTPFGVAIITVTTGDHIYVEMGRDAEMLVNRVAMHMSLYMSRFEDGFACACATAQGLYLNRTDCSSKDVSCAARKRVLDAMVPLVSKWAVEHTEVMEEGFESDRRGRIMRCEAELDCLRENVKGKKEEIRAIRGESFGE